MKKPSAATEGIDQNPARRTIMTESTADPRFLPCPDSLEWCRGHLAADLTYREAGEELEHTGRYRELTTLKQPSETGGDSTFTIARLRTDATDLFDLQFGSQPAPFTTTELGDLADDLRALAASIDDMRRGEVQL
jgi:hypothetical protein